MYDDIAKFCKTCEECPKRARLRVEEPLHPMWTSTVWEKVGVDVVSLPRSEEGFRYAVFARDDLSGWVEGRLIMESDSASVAKSLFEDVICRHGYPKKIVMDGGSENKGVAQALLERHRIKKVDITAFHPQSNGLVERSHDAIVNALAKYNSKNPLAWPRYFHLALWADRISSLVDRLFSIRIDVWERLSVAG
jgi:hypothetical protein